MMIRSVQERLPLSWKQSRLAQYRKVFELCQRMFHLDSNDRYTIQDVREWITMNKEFF
jgi:hypothetical protein